MEADQGARSTHEREGPGNWGEGLAKPRLASKNGLIFKGALKDPSIN